MHALFLIVFSNLLGFGIIIPLLPYYAENFGANPNDVTLLMASYSLMQLIFSPILGRISDIYGRKKNINFMFNWFCNILFSFIFCY